MVDRMVRVRSTISVGVLALVAAACTASTDVVADAPEGDRLQIVATTSILGGIVEDVVGDAADVTVIMAPGVDPHGYQASARDGQILRDADLVVVNGPLDDVPLEENLFDLLLTVRDEGVVLFDAVASIDPLPFAGPHAHDDHDDHDHDHDHDHDGGETHDDHEHQHGDIDPHFWWDLARVANSVERLAEAIAAVDTSRTADFWTERGAQAAAVYRELDDEIQQTVGTLTDDQRTIITNHDSLGYFADRYGFTVRATVVPGASTDAQTNPRAFAALIDVLVTEEIRVIFADNTDSTRLAEQLRTQTESQGPTDVTVVQLYTDALGPAGSGAETFTGMIRETVRLVVDALR